MARSSPPPKVASSSSTFSTSSSSSSLSLPSSPLSPWTSPSSSLLATAAAALFLALCSIPSAYAADFVAPGSVVLSAPERSGVAPQLSAPPSRAGGLARSGGGGSSLSSPSPPPSIELLSGSVRVSDGDTIEITSEADGVKHKVRIWGIDAPETKQ